MKSIRLIPHTIAVAFRGRYKCPNPDCPSVGCWNPHGGPLDRLDLRGARRWTCKWCGLYYGPEGWGQTVIDNNHDMGQYDDRYAGVVGVWRHVDHAPEGSTTPQAVITEYFGRPVNPWKF